MWTIVVLVDTFIIFIKEIKLKLMLTHINFNLQAKI